MESCAKERTAYLTSIHLSCKIIIRAAGVVAVPWNLQSAIAGVILRRGRQSAGLPPESDVDVWVSRDGTL